MRNTPSSSAICIDAPFDFRSQRFGDDAQVLVQLTGRSLVLCRQELFMAEGNLAEARAVIEQGYSLYAADLPLQ